MRECRCVVFCAVSSDPQAREDAQSLREQSSKCRQFVNDLGQVYPGNYGVFVGEISLVGTRSILSFEDACRIHDEYFRLREMISNRQFDVLVFSERDRLGREPSLIQQIEFFCLSHDIVPVSLHSSRPPSLNAKEVRDSMGYIMMSSVEGAMAKAYIRQFVRRTEMGIKARVMRGLFPGRPPYGYAARWIQREDGSLFWPADPVTAPIVREVLLDLYFLHGMGAKHLSILMNERGVPSPSGGRWQRNSLRSFVDHIMAYAGFIEFNRTSRTGREKVLLPGCQEKILTEREAREIREEYQIRQHRNYPKHALSGVCVCASCGGTMRLYRKGHRTKSGEITVTRGVKCIHANDPNGGCAEPAMISEKAVFGALRLSIRTLRENADFSSLVVDPSEQIAAIQSSIASTNETIKTLRNRKSRLLDLYLDNKIAREDYSAKATEIESAITTSEAHIVNEQRQIEDLRSGGTAKERIKEVMESGELYLDGIESRPDEPNTWLRRRFRVFVQRSKRRPGVRFGAQSGQDDRILRVEFI